MKSDFTLHKYDELLNAIQKAEYDVKPVANFLESPNEKCIILRHDVDRDIRRALEMALIENERNIISTYYFRYKKSVFKPDIIKEIAALGHEIGYHYEVLDKSKGDILKAKDIFVEELNDFRKISEVRTVCMHGNPLTPWVNSNLWNHYQLSDFAIMGEPYISIDYSKVLYITDTGRTWGEPNVNVKDIVSDDKVKLTAVNVESTDDVINLILENRISQICISAHPNRWCNDTWGWSKEYVFQNMKNVVKQQIISRRERSNKSAN
jgi:hypothetical protein